MTRKYSLASIGVILGWTALAGCNSRTVQLPLLADRPHVPHDLSFVASPIPEGGDTGYSGDRALDLVETSGRGLVLADLDQDGLPDLVLAGGGTGPGPVACRVLRNLGNGRWADATRGSGFPVSGDWRGCAAADYDNDGLTDVLLTGTRGLRLLRNRGKLRFQSLGAEIGLPASGWYSSAGFADYDGDGRVDLYAGGYVAFSGRTPRFVLIGSAPGSGERVVGPNSALAYPPYAGRLFRNTGERFEDVTRAMGLAGSRGRTLGVAFSDLDADGWPDLYLANDQEPAELYHNVGGKRFEAATSPFAPAFGRDGEILSLRGCAIADWNGDGVPDLIAAAGAEQGCPLYVGEKGLRFREEGRSAGIGLATWHPTANGMSAADFDNDGWTDLLIVNGNWITSADRLSQSPGARQPVQLFRNQSGRFQLEASDFPESMLGRAVATGDCDNDGRIDAVATRLDGAPVFFHNQSSAAGHWLTLRLHGVRSNRLGLGARVEVRSGSRTLSLPCGTAHGYLSSGDPRVHIGLGPEARCSEVQVVWPSGTRQTLRNLDVDREIEVREPASSG